MNFIKNFIKKNLILFILIAYAIGVFALGAKINLFRYKNFDLGKFDLGNMTQMVWNTTQGNFMYLTDYFGTNLPRWAMSHVDPILLLTVPFFLIYQSPLTLVFFQLILLVVSGFIIYKIAEMEFEDKLLALFSSLVFYLYPAFGFLFAWTAFHGVTIAVPFFLGAFYVFEYMYKHNKFTKRNLIIFWTLLVITMTGKEELPLFVVMLGIFILFFRNEKFADIKSFLKTKISKLSFYMIGIGILWFIMAFFVIIPAYSHYRVEGYLKFASDLGINTDLSRDVAKDNYFLSRYEGLGDSYSEVIINAIRKPSTFVAVLFNGDKIENMRMTFDPLLYTPFLFPPLFIIAIPELLINYAITGGGIGTSEIYNHRISMIIPVLILASIYGVSYISKLIAQYTKLKSKHIALFFMAILIISNLQFSYSYGNPIYLWLNQSVQKRFTFLAYARTLFEEDKDVINMDLKIGDRFRLAEFERRDRECAAHIINLIPDNASVSGPDYMGTHLSMRETYGIFPALYNSADFVIVDVFSQKVVELLGIEQDIINEVVGRLLRDKNYSFQVGCGNLFVFQRNTGETKSDVLPIQEIYEYEEKVELEIFRGVFVVDFNFPSEAKVNERIETKFVYRINGSESLDDYLLFTTFVNAKTGEVYQQPNLPSFALNELEDWSENRYYTEINEMKVPEFIGSGDYKVFIGISNDIRTRSIYLGDIEIK